MKKTQIIHTAFELFTENGYAATSIQEIVSICKMSKATFYHYFSSKKELFYELLQFRDELFESQLQALDDKSISSEEKFHKQTELYLETLYDNRTLFLLAPFVIEQEEFVELEQGIKRFKIKTYKRVERMIGGAYPIENVSNRWDLVLLYDALIREYIDIASYQSDHLNIPHAAHCVNNYLDLLVTKHEDIEPLLSSLIMKDFIESNETSSKEIESRDQLIHFLFVLDEKVGKIMGSETEINAYKANLTLLKDELNQLEPRVAVIQSILALVSQQKELTDTVERIKSLLKVERDMDL
ncbi:TetR/AcrR family transcriptional regulator [Alkalicoccobacillus murimartini]|uniref:AcrR family transcriptional regulator n=1 Tax=Alkalicoccobacillus murimartini TaxID=171685 RepID=A0ABT9YDT2_9BACI|nr:TetR/AcrR family transcriptional regulator [Alkalicoccobacillus murimartini]MDQ0205696.1 AcrR family transcriptional regulator [Alkalicoccobacillus murimartini]